MNKKSKKLLNDEVLNLTETLTKGEISDNEYEKIIKRIDDIQTIIDKDAKWQRWFDNGVKVGSVLLPLGAYSLMFFSGLKFEEKGTISSKFVSNVVGKFKL